MSRDLLPQGDLIALSTRDALIQDKQNEFAEGVTALEAFSAGIRRENYTSAWVTDKINKANAGVDQPQFSIDPNYRFEDDPMNEGYDPFLLMEAQSAEEAAAFRDQIDRELAQLRVINSRTAGTLGQMFGGVFQPHVAAALPLAPQSLTALIVAEAGLEAGSEVLLHSMQKTRTLEESMWNVGLVAAGAGILGGAAKGFDTMRGVPKDLIDDINAGAVVGEYEGSAGAAKVVDEDRISSNDDRLIGGYLVDKLSIGQMASLSKSLSDTARKVAAKLADNPLFNRGHAEGKTRGVSVESFHEAAMGRVVIATDKAHALGKQSGLKADDFEIEVGRALSAGDRHTNPQVQAAAEMYRAEVLDPIQEAAQKLGLLDDDASILAKVKQIEEDVARLIEEGAGPGSAPKLAELNEAQAKIIAANQGELDALEQAVKDLEADLEYARQPIEPGGKPQKAPASMVADYNKARSARTAKRKEVSKNTKPLRDQIREIERRNKQLRRSRKKIKELKARQKNQGVQFAESYFPRVYDSDKIYSNWDRLKNQLMEHFKTQKGMKNLEPGELEEIVLETMQNMLGGRSQAVRNSGKPSAFRSRALSMMDEQLEPYLEKRASQVMLKHAQGTQPYIMMREAFDGETLEGMIDQIRRDYQSLKEPMDEAGNKVTVSERELKRLDKEMEKDIQRIRVIADRLMHQVQRSTNPRNPVIRAIQYAKLYNIATFLGGVVLSSLPDIARPIAHYGLRSFGKGVAKGVKQAFSGKGSMDSVQVKRTGAAIQRTLNDRAAQLADSLEPESKWMLKGQKVWSKYSGFDLYTDIMESVASHAAMDYVVRAARKVASTQLDNPLDALSKSERKQIARMGLKEDDLVGIYNESMKTMGAQDGVLKYMDTMQWQDVELAKRAEAAIGSDVRRTIIRIGAGEKPEFMDGHLASWMLQFMSFAMSAQNKIMLAGFQNANRHTAEGLAAMLFLGASVGAAKTYLRGGDMEAYWSPENLVFEGIDRSGMSGILREPMNALRFALAYHGITDAVPSRYVGKGWSRMLASPTASVIDNIAGGIGDAFVGEFGDATEHLMKATPMANTWHLREVLTKLGEEM